jgi:tripartite-type tricarboxylate transporter receptor subunit TctC
MKLVSVLFCLAASVATSTYAQTYPTRTIRFIVPFSAGGGADIQTRMLAHKLTERLGQQVIADNRPGGTTVLATEMTARAPADGYTLLFVTTTFAINPSLRKVPYDIVRDFAPVIQLNSAPNMLVAHPSVPANNARELIRLAKAQPGALNYASAGAGTAAHVSMELMQIMSGTKLTHVPYKGSSQGLIDVMSGEISLLITTATSLLPYIRDGKIKAIAVTSAKRSRAAPSVPTIAEAGLPGYDASGWQGVVAPAGTSREVVAKLNREINGILKLPDVNERMAAEGSEPVGGTPEAFATHIKSEHAKWQKVVKASGAKVD